MKLRLPVKLLTTALLSLWLINGCADQAVKNPASKASPEAMAAITNASDAIKIAKGNNWIWVNTLRHSSKRPRRRQTRVITVPPSASPARHSSKPRPL